jgi:DNA-directed RNA polymerase specialized sigma24 family protein
MRHGDDDAVTRLWGVCYQSAVVYAKRKLGGIPDRLVSPDDIAASAFKSVWKDMVAAPAGDILRSADLWRFLYTSVRRKTIDAIRNVNNATRGDGTVVAESELRSEEGQLQHFVDLCEDPGFQKEYKLTVEEFFEFLPERLRTVASCILTLSISNQELACILQLSLRSVQRMVKEVFEEASRFHNLSGSSNA